MNYFSAFAGRTRPTEDDLVRATVDQDDTRLRALLRENTPATLEVESVRTLLAGSVGRLTPATLQYFLPGLMTLVEEHYDELRGFAAELAGALTAPRRDDVVAAFETASRVPKEFGMPEGMLERLREQQLEWFDSGEPAQRFLDRMAGLSAGEEAAVRKFLTLLRVDHREDFSSEEQD